ncbi:MAG: alpha/beta fold hydrolase [Prochlorococcaceae cyanobacterium]
MIHSDGADRVCDLGRFVFACGQTLEAAQLGYRVYGELSPARDNLVLYPSSYGAWPDDIAWVVGPILDPSRFCVVLVSQFGNGRSSSPSNSAMGLANQGWCISHADNVRAQVRLLEEEFGVERPALIYGWSMGAQQAYHWGVLEPGRCRRLLALCGTARTTPHNRLFLLSLRRALCADPAWDGARFHGLPERGLELFALIYASWAASQPYYRQLDLAALGHGSLEAYVAERWLPLYRRHDPHDLLAMVDTWLACDVAAAAGCGADLAAALGRIRAPTTVIAGSHDLYFPPDDCRAEAALIRGARFTVLPSELGHRAGNPRDAPAEQAAIRSALEELLAR